MDNTQPHLPEHNDNYDEQQLETIRFPAHVVCQSTTPPGMVESTKSHKRKRSLQDSPVDLTKMKMAMQRVQALREELAGIEETEGEMEALMTHVNSLEEILCSAKKPVRGFLLVSVVSGL